MLPSSIKETVDWFMGKRKLKQTEPNESNDQNKLYLESNVLEICRKDTDLKLLVELPPGLDYNEWLASHTLSLFENVNLIYGTISEFCTVSNCDEMRGPNTKTYLWYDEKGKKTRIPAPQYIDYVMTFIQRSVSDENIFPTKFNNPFPSSFESITRKILRLLFHVIAHLYASHFREVVLLGIHTHLNLTFAHLTALNRRFNLIEAKETEPLLDLEIALRLTEDQHNAVTQAATVIVNNSNSSQQQQTSNNVNLNSSDLNDSFIVNSNNCTSSDDGAPFSSTSLQQQQPATTSDVSASALNLIDGDPSAQPIVKQPLETGGVPLPIFTNNNSDSNNDKDPPTKTEGKSKTKKIS